MNRQKINRICGIVPVVMSLAALCIVMVVITTGWERNLTDEGTAAHTFQLLIVAQMPFVLAFLATANWKRLMEVLRPFSLQVLTIGLALGSVTYFKL
jgi:hypothetical protein